MGFGRFVYSNLLRPVQTSLFLFYSSMDSLFIVLCSINTGPKIIHSRQDLISELIELSRILDSKLILRIPRLLVEIKGSLFLLTTQQAKTGLVA